MHTIDIIPPCASPENCAACGDWCEALQMSLQDERED